MFPVNKSALKLDERGQALIQALVAAAILGTVVAGFSAMMNQQTRITQSMNQKLGQMDVLRILTNALADNTLCSYVVANPAPAPFSPLDVGSKTNSPKFSIQQIPLSADPGAAVIAKADGKTPASPMVKELVINGMEVRDFVCSPAPCAPTTSVFNANLYVNFDGSKLITPLAPLVFPLVLTTTASAGNQVVSGCSGGGGGPTVTGPGPSFTAPGCTMYTIPNYKTTLSVKMWGGGGAGGTFGQNGGNTTFDKVVAGGGTGVFGASETGTGGIAYGGDVNLNGATGNARLAASAGGVGGTSPNGGSGGPNPFFDGTGRAPGGGGSSGTNAKGPISNGGGAGAYVMKTFKKGDLTPGSQITICVGAGGRGARGVIPSWPSGGWSGGNGAITIEMN